MHFCMQLQVVLEGPPELWEAAAGGSESTSRFRMVKTRSGMSKIGGENFKNIGCLGAGGQTSSKARETTYFVAGGAVWRTVGTSAAGLLGRAILAHPGRSPRCPPGRSSLSKCGCRRGGRRERPEDVQRLTGLPSCTSVGSYRGYLRAPQSSGRRLPAAANQPDVSEQ